MAALCRLLAALAALAGVAGESTGSPVAKVVKLLTEMKTQVEAEAAEDKDAYDKYVCWCTTNEKLKTEDVAVAETEISRLEVSIEEAVGLQGQLKTEIAALEDDIAEGQDSLAAATSTREKERAAFEKTASEMNETIATLKQAIAVLAKVSGGGAAAPAPEEQAQLLLQLRGIVKEVHRRAGQYRSVMQRDLWDVMSAIDDAASAGGFLPKSRGGLAALAQRHGQLQPTGAAAGAASYNARSSGVLGSLQAMLDTFLKDLGEASKTEADADAGFAKLRDAKLKEISSASERKSSKEKLLADTVSSAAQAKEDLEATMGALSADQQVLVSMGKNCKENEEGYAERSKARVEELKALSEAVVILTEDDARDLFGKTMSLLQTSARRDHGAERQAHSQAVDQAMRRLLHAAKRHKNWALASLAVNVRLDAFTKVKEAMDKMVTELKAQAKAESEKNEACKKDIDSTEDTIKSKGETKEDLEGTKLGLTNKIATLEADIAALEKGIADAKVALKRAGEDRAAENKVFQKSVADQRAAINILGKAKARLSQFYGIQKKTGFLQIRAHGIAAQPGTAVAPPPPKSKEYSKSAGAGGVLQLMDMVIKDAEEAETTLVASEQHAQTSYEGIVKDLNANLAADSQAVVAKTAGMEAAKGDLSEANAALLLNDGELEKLQSTEKALHLDCDFLLKFYDTRQQAIGEEISAIGEAKAILGGADFER